MSSGSMGGISLNAGANARNHVAGLISIGLLLGGVMLLYGLSHWKEIVLEKTPAPLRKDLKELPRMIGDYDGPKDDYLEPTIAEELGAKSYLLRHYYNDTFKESDPAYLVALNLNYYDTGTASPHVPDICWKGAGRVKVLDSEIDVANVPHEDGSTSTIPMRLLSFAAEPGDLGYSQTAAGDESKEKTYLNVAYVFQVNGKYVARREEVLKEFWHLHSKYGYHTKIEITVPIICTPQKAQQVVSDFMRNSLPQIEACLPDWNQLNQTAAISSRQ